ncbi:hypothetical protein Syncc8109_2653 [Synechococcus sp. WH 8109]|nr:hypothetical protein Syncc8109_2653 [Synechococcus sp. WH 8109]
MLTPCPPGPDERLNRHRSSLDGMVNRSFTTRSCTSHLLAQEQQDAPTRLMLRRGNTCINPEPYR